MAGEIGQVDAPVALPVTFAGVAGNRAKFADIVLGDAMQADRLAGDKVRHRLAAAMTEALVVVGVAAVVGMAGQQQAELGVALHLLGHAQQQGAVDWADSGAVDVKLGIALPTPAGTCWWGVRVGRCSRLCVGCGGYRQQAEQ